MEGIGRQEGVQYRGSKHGHMAQLELSNATSATTGNGQRALESYAMPVGLEVIA